MTQTKMSKSEIETLQQKLAEVAHLMDAYGQDDLGNEIDEMIDRVAERGFQMPTTEEAFQQHLDEMANRRRDEERDN